MNRYELQNPITRSHEVAHVCIDISIFYISTDVASDNQAQFVFFNVHSVQNDAVSTFCVVVVCKIPENKGIETNF